AVGGHRYRRRYDLHDRTDDHVGWDRLRCLVRRLDRDHQGRKLDGPVRAHLGGHRQWSGDPHSAVILSSSSSRKPPASLAARVAWPAAMAANSPSWSMSCVQSGAELDVVDTLAVTTSVSPR